MRAMLGHTETETMCAHSTGNAMCDHTSPPKGGPPWGMCRPFVKQLLLKPALKPSCSHLLHTNMLPAEAPAAKSTCVALCHAYTHKTRTLQAEPCLHTACHLPTNTRACTHP